MLWQIVFGFIVTVGASSVLIKENGVQDAGLLNQASVVGSSVTFTCLYDSSKVSGVPQWSFNLPRNRTSTIVSNGDRLRADFNETFRLSVDVERGRTELTIDDVQLVNAGMYSCMQISRDGMMSSHTAQLIVLVADPACSISPGFTISGRHKVKLLEHFEVGCRVRYAGNWAPTIQCLPRSEADHVTYERNASAGSVSYTQRVQALHNRTHTVFNCTTYFDGHDDVVLQLLQAGVVINNTPPKHAENTPNYAVSWASPELKVTTTKVNPSLKRALVIYGCTVLSIVLTAACVVIFVRRAEHRRRRRARRTCLLEDKTYQRMDPTTSSRDGPNKSLYTELLKKEQQQQQAEESSDQQQRASDATINQYEEVIVST